MALHCCCRPIQRLFPASSLLLCQREASTGGGSVGGSLFKSFRQRPRRNPRIIPHAKVKAFKVRPWRQPDPVAESVYSEHAQLYKMQMSALQQAFYYELHGRLLLPGENPLEGLRRLGSREDELADSSEARRQADDAERLNAEWNARSAEARQAGMRRDLEAMRDRRDRLRLDAELAEKAAVLTFQARLKKDVADSADFIVDEATLDAKIDAILDSPIVDFNFAVDPAGNIVRDRPGSGGAGSGSGPPAEPPSVEELSVRV